MYYGSESTLVIIGYSRHFDNPLKYPTMLNFVFFLISENLREHAGQVPRCVPAGTLRAAGGHPPHQPRHTHPLQADSANTTKLMPQFETDF